MTLETFKSNVGSYRRFEILRGGLFMALMGAAAAPTMFAVRRLDRVGFDAASVLVVSASYTLIVVLMLFVLFPMRKRYLRKLQAECPGCGRLLLGKQARSVIAFGQCPTCGTQVLQSHRT